jgi:hypothetical protein
LSLGKLNSVVNSSAATQDGYNTALKSTYDSNGILNKNLESIFSAAIDKN